MKRTKQVKVWERRLRAWERSGLTIEKFCESEGISKTTFYKWRRLVREEAEATQPAAVEFIEISRHDEPPGVELVTLFGAVRLRPDFDEATLERLLNVLDNRR